MDDVYVRNDVFEEVIKRMEAQTAASEARTAALISEIRGQVEAYRSEVKEYRADSRRETESLAGDIRAIKDRLDSIENAATRRWTITGVFVAIVSAGITLFSVIPAIRAALGL